MTPIVTMSRQLSWLMLSGTALWQLSSAGPVDPTITPPAFLNARDESAGFIGYWTSGSFTSSFDCNDADAMFNMGATYAGCCFATNCPLATACTYYSTRGYMVYPDPGSSSPSYVSCTGTASICNTAFVHQNPEDPNPKSLFFCDSGNTRSSVYRQLPPASTTRTSDASAITTLPETSITTPAEPTQPAEPKTSSKAWIAGVVVGPLLGLALVAAGVLLCLRRKKKKNAQAPQHGVATMAHVNPSQPPAGVAGYTDAKPQFQPAQNTYYGSQQEQAYPLQGAFSPPQVSPPVSPAPQYAYQAPYNTSSSPPNATYTQDVKRAAHSGAAELGGSNVIAPATSAGQGAELGGQNERTGRQ